MTYNLHYTTLPSRNGLVLYHYQDCKIEDLYIRSDFVITKFKIDDHCFDSLHKCDLPYLDEHIKDRLNYLLYVLKRDQDMVGNFKFIIDDVK